MSIINIDETWEHVDTAPTDGSTIIGLYPDGECEIFWSDGPVCILGPRCGSFPEGWATCGGDTDHNLPVDPPIKWRHC